MAPPPKGRSASLQPKGTISGAAAAAADNLPPRQAFAVSRERSNSAGSTRDAFYKHSTPKTWEQQAPTLPQAASYEIRQRRRKAAAAAKKQQSAAEQQQQSQQQQRKQKQPSVSDMANLAMQSLDPLGNKTSDIVVGVKPTSSAEARRATLAGNRIEQPVPHHKQQMSPKTGGKPLKEESMLLATIRDDSNSSDMLDYSGREASFFFSEQPASSSKKGTGDNLASSVAYDKASDSLRYSVGLKGFESFNNNNQRDSSLYGASLLDNSTTKPKSTHGRAPSQQDEINMFASMVHAAEETNNNNYGSTAVHESDYSDDDSKEHSIMDEDDDFDSLYDDHGHDEDEDDDLSYEDDVGQGRIMSCLKRLLSKLDPTDWLTQDAIWDEDSKTYYFEESSCYSLAGLVRHFLYNPVTPELTSLQQFVWAVIIGILMGVYTAIWKWLIESGIDFLWETVPATLLEWGVFTELGGAFPLYHYMWIVPAIFGGLLSYIFAVLPTKIPDQNEWINSVNLRGVQDSQTFLPLFILSTVGMWSGLSLGPELYVLYMCSSFAKAVMKKISHNSAPFRTRRPLVLTAGMAGSYLGIITKQSMLQARVLNLTAASAAVGGFFGFPMAGALFVLEM